VITSQGVYCLNHDLATAMTSGNAIDIQTNNVTVDCNGYKIGGLAAGPSSVAYGIHADTTRQNITIRNCGIRGFVEGIYLVAAPDIWSRTTGSTTFCSWECMLPATTTECGATRSMTPDNSIAATDSTVGTGIGGNGATDTICIGNTIHKFTTAMQNCQDGGGNVSN